MQPTQQNIDTYERMQERLSLTKDRYSELEELAKDIEVEQGFEPTAITVLELGKLSQQINTLESTIAWYEQMYPTLKTFLVKSVDNENELV